MPFAADLHVHSYLSRACSKELVPERLHAEAQRKGLAVLSTGDFTHPRWFAELQEKLVAAEPGLFRLRGDLAAAADLGVPASCRAPVRFLLGVEISCIYKEGGRVRRVHHLVYAPSFAAAGRIRSRLGGLGNIGSDGRPILGLDSRSLLELVLESGEGCCLVPAHAWTPHFAVFGSESGFDSLEECFKDLAPEVFALETGLSSDPPLNRRVSGLDRLALVSNSDAHSPEKLGREATLFDCELSYERIFGALRGRGGLAGTLEFFPEEGKYHADGHRRCGTCLEPRETLRRKGLCPECGKALTIGVLHRVETLADRAPGYRAPKTPGFERLVPLKEVLGQALRVGPGSLRVDRLYHGLLARFGSELRILRELPLGTLEPEQPLLALALGRMRRGEAAVSPGYDGEYGSVSLLSERDFESARPLARSG